MAVAENHLGRAVRCPHCREVVTTAAAPESPPPLQPFSEAEQEQIFGLGEHPASLGATDEPASPAAQPHFTPGEPAPWDEEASEGTTGAPGDSPWPAATPAHEGGSAGFPEATAARTPVRRGSGWLLGLVILPLISYSILATIVIIIQYQRLQRLTADTGNARPSPEKSTARQ
jgi:hypothetical protein